MRSTLVTAVLLFALTAGPAPVGAAGSGKLIAKMQGEATNQNGGVRLTQTGPSLLVEIHLNGASGKTEPANLHHGNCSEIGPVVAPLKNVVNGSSSTTLTSLTLQKIRQGTYAVLVHASPTDLGRYVSCGDIGRGAKLTDESSMKGFGGKPSL